MVTCSVGLLLRSSAGGSPATEPPLAGAGVARLPRAIRLGLIVMVLSILLDWGVIRLVYGDRPAPHASLHIRFGPNATATKAKPSPGAPHP